jgi:hypothetical protein
MAVVDYGNSCRKSALCYEDAEKQEDQDLNRVKMTVDALVESTKNMNPALK